MKERLIDFLLYLLARLGYDKFAYGLSDVLLEAARQATGEAERKGGARSGEAKRAQAFRMLLNLCPDESQRHIALAIELCLPR